MTSRALGDLRPPETISPDSLPSSAHEPDSPARPWRFTSQVHGATVSTAGQGEPADALVAMDGSGALAMFAADCALLAVASREGPIAAVHAGWPGLVAGVIEAAAAVLREGGASDLFAVRSACIHPECYEFGEGDLATVAALYGDTVRSVTAEGRPALDLPETVRRAAESAGITIVQEIASCTACATDGTEEPAWYSHRARRDAGRHAVVVFRP